MRPKVVVLSEETRILLNKAISKILKEDPKTRRVTDDSALKKALKKFVGV